MKRRSFLKIMGVASAAPAVVKGMDLASKPDESVTTVVEPRRAGMSENKVVMFSTPSGKNHFYDAYAQAVSEEFRKREDRLIMKAFKEIT